MLLRGLLALIMLLASAIAAGADSTDSSSPYDKNPACMDRTTDASTGNCVIKDEGTPRHTYPPPPSAATPGPAPLPAGKSPTVRKSSTGGK